MVRAPADGRGGSSGEEQGNILQGKGSFLPCCLRGMVFPDFAGAAAIGAVDRKRKNPGIDGTPDRTAERYRDLVFLLWGNTVGDCKGTWHYTATVSQTLVTALRRMRDSQKKDSPSGKKADFKRVK